MPQMNRVNNSRQNPIAFKGNNSSELLALAEELTAGIKLPGGKGLNPAADKLINGVVRKMAKNPDDARLLKAKMNEGSIYA